MTSFNTNNQNMFRRQPTPDYKDWNKPPKTLTEKLKNTKAIPETTGQSMPAEIEAKETGRKQEVFDEVKAPELKEVIKEPRKPKKEEIGQQKEKKEVIDARKEARTIGQQAGNIEGTEAILQSLNAKVDSIIPRKQTSEYSGQREQIDKRLKELQAESESAKKTNAWAQLAEQLSHSLTQLAAAMYGEKHGVDMSGLKFNKTDWHRKLNDSLNQYSQRERNLLQQKSQLIETEEKEVAQTDRERNRLKRQLLAAHFQEEKDKRRADLEIAKQGMLWDRQMSLLEKRLASREATKQEKAQMKKVENEKKAADKEIENRIKEIKDEIAPYQTVLKDIKARGKSSKDIETVKRSIIANIHPHLNKREEFSLYFNIGEMIEDENWTELADYLSQKVKAGNKRIKALGSKEEVSVQSEKEKTTQPTLTKATAPHGNKVEQDGVTYIWNGTTYVPEK